MWGNEYDVNGFGVVVSDLVTRDAPVIYVKRLRSKFVYRMRS